MKTKIGFIHTSATLVPLFQSLQKEKLKDADAFHISDDSLIKDVIRDGKLTPAVSRRVANLVHQAEDAGATHILVTCSSIGEAVDDAASTASVPVLRVDRPMARQAVESARRIGVIATLPTTLEPTRRLVEKEAAEAGREVAMESRLCKGAFEALMSGDSETHDEKVRAGLAELMEKVDVIVLAQASMARVVETIPPEKRTCPILSSPGPAVDYLAESIS